MWGNRLGWSISAAMLIAAIALAVLAGVQLATTPPTALSLNADNLVTLVPPMPTEGIGVRRIPGDAGPTYRQAIAAYEADSNACDDYARTLQGAEPKAIQLVAQAAGFATMDLFSSDPSQIVDYQSDHPPLDNLVELGRIVDRVGLMYRLQKKLDLARPDFQAVHALGEKLYTERLTYDEYAKGLALMNESTIALSECDPPGSERRLELEKYESSMVGYDRDHVLPIYTVLSSADQDSIAIHAGDVFRIAEMAGERMFRVEAILKVGRYRFDASRMGDQLAAPRLLRKLGHDSDPVIRAAVDAAGALTIEQYRTIH